MYDCACGVVTVFHPLYTEISRRDARGMTRTCAPAPRLKQRQEQELLAPAADDEEEEEEESEYETDSGEEDGFGRALLKPVFVPKVWHSPCCALPIIL